jgi:hypothetical protein
MKNTADYINWTSAPLWYMSYLTTTKQTKEKDFLLWSCYKMVELPISHQHAQMDTSRIPPVVAPEISRRGAMQIFSLLIVQYILTYFIYLKYTIEPAWCVRHETLLSTKRVRERLWVGWRFFVLVTWIFPRFVERPLIGQCFIWIIYDNNIIDKWHAFKRATQ